MDNAVFRQVQPHYVANPIFIGIADPVPRRSGLLLGSGHEVALDLSRVPAYLPSRAMAAPPAPVCEATGRKIDGRNEGGRATRWREFSRMLAEGGDVDLDIFAERSWSAFNAEFVTGRTALSANTYTWSNWHKSCQDDLPRLQRKLRRGLVPGVEPFHAGEEVSLSEAAERLEQIVSDFASMPRATGVRITAGSGKTKEAATALARRAGGRRIHWYCPDHRVGAEVREQFLAANPNLKVLVVEGRERARCRRRAAVKAAEERGLPVQKLCCAASKDKRCPYYDECAYQQRLDQKYDVYIMPRQYLTVSLDDRIPAPDITVIDEDFFVTVAQPLTIAEHEFTGPTMLLAVNGGIRPVDVGRAVVAGLRQQDVSLPVYLAGRGIGPEVLSDAATALEHEWRGGLRGIDVASAGLAEQLGLMPKRPAAVDVFRQIATEWGFTAGVRGVVYRDGALVLRRLPDLTRLGEGVLLLDATAEESLLRLIWPDLEFHEIKVKRNAAVKQVYDNRLSKRSLASENNRYLPKLQKFLNDLGRKHTGGVVITYAAVEKSLRVPDGWHLDHFGNVRGTNAYTNCEAVVVIGRNMPPETAVQDLAAAAASGHDIALDPASGRQDTLHGYNWRSGKAGVECSIFADPLLAAADRLIVDAETEQALDRIRAVRAVAPKAVYLLSSHVVDVIVDELVMLNDMIGWGKMDEAQARIGPVLPLSASWLAANLPDLFPDERSAERAVHAERGGDAGVRDKPSNLFIGPIDRFDGLSRIPYRLPGARGHPSLARVTAGTLADITAELKRLHGVEVSMLVAELPMPGEDGAIPEGYMEVTDPAALPAGIPAWVLEFANVHVIDADAWFARRQRRAARARQRAARV